MRSKRKEVNKFAFRAVVDHHDDQEDLLHRSSGIKPFQLVKIRQGQRSTLDLAHTNNQILHRRGGSNNLYGEEKEMYMDLIIKQKLIVDAQVNQKLQSQRKNIVSVSRAEDDQGCKEEGKVDKGQIEGEEVQIYSQANEAYCLQSSHQQQSETVDVDEPQQQRKRKRSKCQCCLQLNNATNAIIRHKNEQNSLPIGQTEQRQINDEQAKAVEQTMRELKAMKQKALPPFSFTSLKWRSKSEILQVDKWKQRYGKDMHLTQKLQVRQKAVSSSKYDKGKTRREVPAYQYMEGQRTTLPILHKAKQAESKPKIFKWSPSKRDDKEVIRIYNPEGDSKPAYFLMSTDGRREKEGSGRRMKQEEEKTEIAIKKMYDSQQKTQQLVAVQKEEEPVTPEPQSAPQKLKPKRKKSKFPEIQISTFYSTKEEAIQRRRLRLESMQRLAREWRYNQPKKVYLQKIMEEIPERWEYGQSRESSRQVDHYLQHQQEQARMQQLNAEQQLQEELQLMKAEEEYLRNAELEVPVRP